MTSAWVALGVVLAVAGADACEGNTIAPENAAGVFATRLGLELQGHPVCTELDSDGDGYVTCTLALKSAEGPPQLLSLQCAALRATNASGCKQTTPKALVRP